MRKQVSSGNPFVESLMRDADPQELAKQCGLPALYGFQRELLDADENLLIVKGRQIGASTAISLAVLAHVLGTEADGEPRTAIIASPSQRQSSRLLSVVSTLYARLGRPVAVEGDNQSTLTLANGNQVVSLPGGSSGQVRGFRATLLVGDEAAYITDEFWLGSLLPMTLLPLASGRSPQVILAGTPGGKRGFFWEMWADAPPDWTRMHVKTSDVLPADRVAELRRQLGPWLAAIELDGSFEESGSTLFTEQRLMELIDPTLAPLFPQGRIAMPPVSAIAAEAVAMRGEG